MTQSDPAAPDALTQPFRHAVQIGVVVRDLEQSMAMPTTVFGLAGYGGIARTLSPGSRTSASGR